jgi:hypothetical protein
LIDTPLVTSFGVILAFVGTGPVTASSRTLINPATRRIGNALRRM